MRETTGSTNADIMALGREGAPEGIVLVARSQTAGRGRHGRTWVAPAGSGLLCTVLLRPPGSCAGLVTATVALAALDAVEKIGARGVGIKWPNDLVVSVSEPMGESSTHARERKLAGILAEAEWVGQHLGAPSDHDGDSRVLVAAGLGLNTASVAEIPSDIAARRISLEDLLGTPVPIEEVLDHYLVALDDRYRALLAHQDEILDDWQARCVTLGRNVQVDIAGGVVAGRATRTDDHGRLVIQSEAGGEHVVSAGDVMHLSDR